MSACAVQGGNEHKAYVISGLEATGFRGGATRGWGRGCDRLPGVRRVAVRGYIPGVRGVTVRGYIPGLRGGVWSSWEYTNS